MNAEAADHPSGEELPLCTTLLRWHSVGNGRCYTDATATAAEPAQGNPDGTHWLTSKHRLLTSVRSGGPTQSCTFFSVPLKSSGGKDQSGRNPPPTRSVAFHRTETTSKKPEGEDRGNAYLSLCCVVGSGWECAVHELRFSADEAVHTYLATLQWGAEEDGPLHST